MKKATIKKEPTVFEQIEQGLRQAIAHARGELVLKTTMLSAPNPKKTQRSRKPKGKK
jgi:hypothetical protein